MRVPPAAEVQFQIGSPFLGLDRDSQKMGVRIVFLGFYHNLFISRPDFAFSSQIKTHPALNGCLGDIGREDL